jgi:transcriptional regulator with XRE-family HTH domain
MNTQTPKALEKSFDSVEEMLKDSGVSKELLATVEDVRHQQVTNALAKIRVSKGLTQKQLADMIGCTQGRISKLETGRDDDLRLKDILDYARVTETSLQIGVGTHPTHAQAIKFHVFAMKRHLDALVGLAKGDDEGITTGVVKFFDEVLFNVAYRLGQCAKELSKLEAGREPEIEVISSEQVDDLAFTTTKKSLALPPADALAEKG